MSIKFFKLMKNCKQMNFISWRTSKIVNQWISLVTGYKCNTVRWLRFYQFKYNLPRVCGCVCTRNFVGFVFWFVLLAFFFCLFVCFVFVFVFILIGVQCVDLWFSWLVLLLKNSWPLFLQISSPRFQFCRC